MKKNAVVRKILFTISLVCLCCAVTQRAVPQKADSPDPQETGTVKTIPLRPLPDGFLTGLTIDDTWYEVKSLDDIMDALKAMKTKPVARIVISKDEPLSSYLPLFKAVHEAAFIMACPVDSFDMKSYRTVRSYKNRFEAAYRLLSPYTDMWEIGNEINGEDWLGKNPQFIAAKMTAAYDFIRSNGGRTVLTAYGFAPEKQKIPMIDWLEKYVPAHIKTGLDYLLVSYYETDNDGFRPDWMAVFTELERLFPQSKLGIGECGTTEGAPENEKTELIRRYYRMPKYTKNYIGGYFWWYWVQDCVPHQNNPVWKALNGE